MAERARRADWILLGTVVGLLVLGVEMVYSASFVVAHNEFQDDLFFLTRQGMWIVIGVVCMAIVARMDYRSWRHISLAAMGLCLLSLIVVLVPGIGVTNYGAQRWIALPGGLPPVQPSEFAKLALVLYMSDWLARKGKQVGHFTYGAVPFVIVLALVAGLVMLGPDLGTTIIIMGTAISLFFVAGANLLHFLLGVVVATMGALWFVFTAAYRVERVSAFLDPWKDQQGSGWHTIQTLIALGSGGLFGRGLGYGRQKAYWMPNAHTDGIFANIGEELGLIGTITVLLLFGIIAWRGLLAAHRAPDTFGRLLATGATCMITWQALVNIAVTTNTIPNTGVTLPFVSFGGSSMVSSLVAVGIILSVARARAAPVVAAEESASSTPLRAELRPRVHPRPALARQPVAAMASDGSQVRRMRRRHPRAQKGWRA